MKNIEQGVSSESQEDFEQSRKEHINLLIERASESGITLAPEKADQLIRHLEMVLIKNREMNLTAIREFDKGIDLHIIDSLLLVQYLEKAPEGVFCDLGTGAGYPGIPLVIDSNRDGLLIDSTRKKIDAVQEFVSKLQLNDRVGAESIRAEELALKNNKQFAVVVCRAVSALPSLVELASPLLIDGGLLIASKGQLEDNELERGNKVANIVGMNLQDIYTCEIPSEDITRDIAIYKKTRKSTIKLPRRNGLAQKNPLA